MKFPEKSDKKRPTREVTADTVMNHALRLLSVRPLTRTELLTKLRTKTYPEPWIQETLRRCENFRYINDDQIAADYAENLTENGYGTCHIRAAMSKRGFSESLVLRETEKSVQHEKETVESIVTRRMTQFLIEKNPLKRKQKFQMFFVRRGFSSNALRHALHYFNLTRSEYEDAAPEISEFQYDDVSNAPPESSLSHRLVAPERENPIEDALALLEKRRRRLESESDPRKRRDKIYRYLLSKQFSHDQIRLILTKFE